MITWFQRVFGKHFKWILLTFLGVMLVSFIVSIGAVPRLSMQGNQGQPNLFLGVNKNDPQVMRSLARAVQESYQLKGQQINSEQELMNLIDYRIVLMHLADEWNMPEPTTQQWEDYLKSVPAFRDADGKFSEELYQKFRDNVESAPTQQRNALIAELREECRLERVRNILGGPGYALPFVAQSQLALNKITSDLDVATLDYKSYTPKIEQAVDKLDAALKELYLKDPTRFPVPTQANLSYIKYSSAPVAEPTATDLQDYAKLHKDKFPDSNPESLSDKDKTAVTEAWRKEQKDKALTEAKNQTMTFTRSLYELMTQAGATQLKLDSPAFTALLAKYHLTLQKLPTVTVGKPVPADSPIADAVLQEAAETLNAQSPVRPTILPDGAAVLFYVDSKPARPSTFEEVREDVLKLYTESEKQKQFTEHCTALRDALVKELAAGKTFTEAAKAQGFSVSNYPTVTMEDIEKTLVDMPFGEASKTDAPAGPLAALGRDALTALYMSDKTSIPLIMALKVKEASPVLTQGNTGLVFYVVKREAAAVPANSPEVQKVDRRMAERENFIASLYMLDRLANNFRQKAP